MISYFGKTNLKEKINKLIDEMANDDARDYIIKIEETRQNETIKRLSIITIGVHEKEIPF